jgi:uroporphyrin-III C-methyltransferase
MAPISLLTAIDSTSHIHLVVGFNPLAAARCAKSLEVGAKPRLIAPETAELHYTLQKRIESGEVEWLKKSFEDEDVLRFGREEINGVVDAVFVTSGSRDPLSRSLSSRLRMRLMFSGAHISQLCKRNRIPVNVSDAPQLCTLSSLHTPTGPYKSE